MLFSVLSRLVLSRHQRERRVGYVAEYCRACRKVLPFDILEQRVGYHVFFIPVEKGQFLGNVQICTGCRTEALCQISQFTGASRSKEVPIDSLAATTNPGVFEKYREELDLAARITSSSEEMDPEMRHRLMMEAFGLAEPHFKSGFGHQGIRILNTSLRPLAPRREEIHACLERFRDAGTRMGARLRTDEVMALIYPESVVKDPNKFSY